MNNGNGIKPGDLVRFIWTVNNDSHEVTRTLPRIGMIEVDFGDGEVLLVRASDYEVIGA